MDPKILPQSITEEDGVLKFTLSGVNVSIANSLRRCILSKINTVICRTYNEEVNQCKIIQNTTSFNNEIIKQRLGCIPIHITDLDIPLENYLLVVDAKNMTDTIHYVTTKDFKIKNITTDEYLTENDTEKIFPPSPDTGYYIDFLRLKPKISNEIPEESIELTCKFSIGNAEENGMYNVVSCCTYGNTVDDVKQELELNKLRKTWKDQGLNGDQIKFEETNWRLLDGLRIVKKDSYDFMIETVGVFTNEDIVKKGCQVIINELEQTNTQIEKDKIVIKESTTTMNNSFDIILENGDYTIGKIIEYMLYTKLYEADKKLSFCGFVKEHPHRNESIIRLAYTNPTNKSIIKGDLNMAITELIKIYKKIETLI